MSVYRVMVVDDEPTAVNLIKTIIEKKCEQFQVSDIAYDGREALEKMEADVPDVLITDIQMPVMNGLRLIEKAKELYPDMLTVVVSGYQEFEYAKEAMHFGVTDYILKPIVPSELKELFQKIQERLKVKYYGSRNAMLHKLVNEIPVEQEDLKRFFQSSHYYGAIVRRNGLPTRFAERNQREVFSDINEWMVVYGRDDQETLYLCPEEILCGADYVQMIKKQMSKEQPEASYVTTVICSSAISVDNIGTMVKGLYRVLDSHLVLGKSQTLLVDYSMVQKPEEQDNDYGYLQDLEYLAKNQKYERLQKETENLIRKWGREERPQIWMESRLRQICYLLQRYGAGNEDYRECEFLLDEAFANAEDIEQLSASMADILFKDKKEDSAAMQRVSTEEYFQRIKEYIHTHMAQPLTLQVVSKEMGVSQTYLSRLFRKFENASFNSYLTALRMEKAKKLLQSEDKIFVKDVAEQVGYKDQFYFSRIFYSYTGVRPSEYIDKE